MKPIKAWHFVGDKLRDGRPVPKDGVTLKHYGEIELCKSGLHASKLLIDALKYAPASTLCRVECGGEVIHGDDKLVCTERTILWRIESDMFMRRAACRFALEGKHLWDMPEIVERYLTTHDENMRLEAYSAAASASAACSASEAYLAAASASAACSLSFWASAACSSARTKRNRILTDMAVAEHRKRKGQACSGTESPRK